MRFGPTQRLVWGLVLALAGGAAFAGYALRQVAGLRALQTETIDRNRANSLQLLRVESNLSALGLSLRDMLDRTEPYPLSAYRGQLARLHGDLEDALRRERAFAPRTRTESQQSLLLTSERRLWQSIDRMLNQPRDAAAREAIRSEVTPQLEAMNGLVSRLIVQNHEAQEIAASEVQRIHATVERNIYVFIAAMLAVGAVIGLMLIWNNQRLFRELADASQQRSLLAGRLIAVQEEVLRSVSRELHDEFGQILTAVGVMLTRAERKGLPPDSPLRADIQEIRAVLQETLEKVRSLSKVLHPAVLDDHGLEEALRWYTEVFEKQTGVQTTFRVEGQPTELRGQAAIHIFRVVQEALNNVAKHSGSTVARVLLTARKDGLRVIVEDDGAGMKLARPAQAGPGGLGLVAMRERAELLHGTIEWQSQPQRGTRVVLDVRPQEVGA